MILNILLVIYALIKIKYMLNIYQQSNYNLKEYIKYFFENIIYNNLFIFLFFIITLIVPTNSVLYVIYIYFIIYALLMYKGFRKKLIFTNRIKRKLLFLAVTTLFLFFISDLRIITFIIIFYEFFSIISLFLINLFEKICSNKFIRTSSHKLKKYDKKIIGISGSYGKTSVKHFLGEVLNEFESSLYTKQSYNTPLGISKIINENTLDVFDSIILEYGASKVGDSKYLLKKYKCNIGILTSLGDNHLDSFKTIDNIVKEESLVINTLKDNEVGFVNLEDERIRSATFNTNAKIISVGINHGDYKALNIKDDIKVSFDVYYKDKLLGNVSTSLIGKHNVINILFVIAIMDYFNYDLNIVFNKLKQLKNVNSRLSIKKYDDYTVINDAFNSNINGSINALKLLNNYDGLKFLITTKFAQMKKLDNINNVLYTKEIVKNVDVCILVSFNESIKLYNLIDHKIKVYIVDNIKEAFELFYLLKENNSYLLLDNDLPDLYLRRTF